MSNDNSVAFMNLAALALHGGHDEEAIRFFKSALELQSDLTEAYIGVGLAYGRMDKHAEMVDAFRSAVRTNSAAVRRWAKASMPRPYVWLSFSPEYAHITGKMAEFLRKADEADALARLAAGHIGHGQDKAAIFALEYCLTLTPDYEAAIILLIICYLMMQLRKENYSSEQSALNKVSPKLARGLFSDYA